MTRRAWPLWLCTFVILLLVLPWTTFQNHTHWQSVAWVPFVSPPITVRDVIGNVVLYLPWGFFLARMPRAPRRLWAIALLAALLSIGTEAAQLYSHGRFPSSTDATCNILGAIAGARYARRRTAASNRSTADV